MRRDRSILQHPAVPRYQHIEAGGHYDQDAADLDRQHGQCRARRLLRDYAVRADGRRLGVGQSRLGALGSEPRRAAGHPGCRRIGAVRGRADNMPSPGIQMGNQGGARAALSRGRELSQPRGNGAAARANPPGLRATDLVLLDPGEPDGYVRNWAAPGFPPMRHIGYAVQWFALALTLAVIYVVTNFAARTRE